MGTPAPSAVNVPLILALNPEYAEELSTNTSIEAGGNVIGVGVGVGEGVGVGVGVGEGDGVGVGSGVGAGVGVG